MTNPRPQPSTNVQPGDKRYPSLSRGFNQRWIARPEYVRVLRSSEEARDALQTAVRETPRDPERTRITVRSGGHCYELLAENGLAPMYDEVVVVDAPEETQLDRLVARRGMTEEDARARMAAQASREERRAVATHVIDNSGTLDDLKTQVDALWESLTRRAAP
jgi:dephospho-CoA kinase